MILLLAQDQWSWVSFTVRVLDRILFTAWAVRTVRAQPSFAHLGKVADVQKLAYQSLAADFCSEKNTHPRFGPLNLAI